MNYDQKSHETTIGGDFSLASLVAFILGMVFLFVHFQLQTDAFSGTDPLRLVAIPVVLSGAACFSAKWSASIGNPVIRIAGLVMASLSFVITMTYLHALLSF